MPDSIRAFFALPVRDADKPALVAAQARMRPLPESSRLSARYIVTEQLHVTLKFLGFISPTLLPALEAIGARFAQGGTAFELAWGGVIAFGSPSRARALVAAVEPSDDRVRLCKFATALDREVEAHGIEREQREFVPHVTLARLKRPGNALRLLEAAALPGARARFEEVRLYRSVQTREGGVYSVIASWPFGAG